MVFGFEGMELKESIYEMARWLSWLERRPVTAEVVGSNPIRVVKEDVAQPITSWKKYHFCFDDL